jgi:hypothetical protein
MGELGSRAGVAMWKNEPVLHDGLVFEAPRKNLCPVIAPSSSHSALGFGP